MNFRTKKWQVVALLLLIFLSIGIFIQFSLGLGILRDDAKGLFLNSFSKNPFRKQSQVNVSLVDNKLNMVFDLTAEDRPLMDEFVRNWFGKAESVENLSFEIDDNTKKLLSPVAPVNLMVKFSGKSVEFNSQSIPLLQNALIKNNFEFASGSGKINASFTDSSKYQFKVENPSDLVSYATSSGMLTASDKIERLFKSLPQVATIELNVNGKNISGQIVLK